MKIALDYLTRIGEAQDMHAAYEFIGRHVAKLIDEGQRSHLMLANLSIGAYQRSREHGPLHLVK